MNRRLALRFRAFPSLPWTIRFDDVALEVRPDLQKILLSSCDGPAS
jgi:hypothetical protein